MKKQKFAQNLIDFIYDSPSAFHAVDSVKNILLGMNFVEVMEEDHWELKKGGKYFVVKNLSAIVAFIVGSGEPEKDGFKIIGAHTDSPSFRIKPRPEIVSEGVYIKLNTEVYGGPILNTWLDRPLSIAGRVILKGEDPFYPVEKLLNINKPILIIPNLAIHMNRNVNSGVELNKQKDMLPILGQINECFEKENYLMKILATGLNVHLEDILDFDLFLYEYEKGTIMGLKNEFISSSRLDDLAMVHAGLNAFINSKVENWTNVVAFFDNEEVGSYTKQGADSELLAITLERVLLSGGKGREDYFRALSRSFLISADLAHGVHPNSPEKADPVNRPIINKGPVIKISASQSYTSDGNSVAVYEAICKNAGVTVQKFVNRSDEKGGSTIGPISSTHLNIRAVDVGSPILAMHSIRELGGVEDQWSIFKSFEKFFS